MIYEAGVPKLCQDTIEDSELIIEVNNDYQTCIDIQKALFSSGYFWINGGTEVMHPFLRNASCFRNKGSEQMNYLVITNKREIYYRTTLAQIEHVRIISAEKALDSLNSLVFNRI